MQKALKILSPYLFLLPASLILIVFFFYPLIDIFYLSLTKYSIVNEPIFIGLKNFQKLYNDPIFWKALKNSIIFLIGAVPPLVIIPIFLAVLINNTIKGISFFRALFYLPSIISIVVIGIAWKWIYSENGPLNYILNLLHITNDKLLWLSNPNLALFSVIIVTVWRGLGYYMIIYLAGLQSIPKDLYESCEIDGGGFLAKHLNITIPLLKPSIVFVAVVSSINALKVFVEIYVLTGGGPAYNSTTLVQYIYEKAFQSLELGYACALGVVLFVITFVFSMVNVKIIERNWQV
ncbi:MAG: lactose ABC transporter permease [Candidatus Sericytochromatia bacterium]|nr:MAG: lactose ABC transporter permease [Candidatus Sericytochromatia bacterium]